MQKGLIVHTIIFNEKNQILILQRSVATKILPNQWDIPGGTLEDGEDPALGVIRETKEEAGLDIKNPSLFFYTSNVDKRKDKQFVRLIFIAEYQSGEVKLSPREHQDYKWIDISEDSKYQTVDYLGPCLEMLKSKSNKLFKL
ncbi:NUDIX hydrolase [Candidatus Parcubacteria bacterium]|nr:NUDIX hydrolase [Candidatus Parcubacteria bacterium]